MASSNYFIHTSLPTSLEVTTSNRVLSGPLARIGPNTLITDDPDIVRHMSSARSPYTRSGWYEGVRVDPYVDNVMSTMDVAVHDKIRAKMAGGVIITRIEKRQGNEANH